VPEMPVETSRRRELVTWDFQSYRFLPFSCFALESLEKPNRPSLNVAFHDLTLDPEREE